VLDALTGDKTRGKIQLQAVHMQAFERAKELLKQAATLARFDPSFDTLLVTDASDNGAGAALYQRRSSEDHWRPIAFWSKAFTHGAMLGWSTWEKELFALLSVCKRWRHWIEAAGSSGKRVTVWTDNSVVRHLRTATLDTFSGQKEAKVKRWARFIASMPVDISHIPGDTNLVADFLSRETLCPGDGTLDRMRSPSEITEDDDPIIDDGPELALAIRRSPRSRRSRTTLPQRRPPLAEQPLALVPFDASDNHTEMVWRRAYLDCPDYAQQFMRLESAGSGGRGGFQDGAHLFKGVIQVGGRTLVPTHLRDRVVREMHRRMGHPGKERLVRAIEGRFDWPHLRREVKEACSTCGTCNLLKGKRIINRVVNAPFPVPPTRFSEITLDFASLPPEPDVRGQQFDKALFIVDRATRFITALPCLGSDEAATIWRLFEDGYLCRFGPPATALTDRDPIFVSSTWRNLATTAGIRWVYSTAGHAQTDGLSERAIRSIKEELQATRLDNPELTWPHLLQQAVFGHNTTPHTRMGVAPFKLAHGYLPEILPVGLAPPRSDELDTNEDEIEQRISNDVDRAHYEFSRRQRQDERQHRHSRPFHVGEWVGVFNRRPTGPRLWAPRWLGPFQVTAATEAGAVELDIEGN
jgi:transposase InsO family protein